MSQQAEARPDAAGARAVVVCEHVLLGEGLAARLRDSGVSATVVAHADADLVTQALARHPEVVITECSAACRAKVRTLCPDATVIDIGNVIGRGCPDAADLVRFDAIWAALGG